MKHLFHILFFVLTANQLTAQNIFPTSGNAGIGTTTPGYFALAIERSNTDGGSTDAPAISVKNISTFQPNGSGLNAAWANFIAGNGAVTGQVVANYGVGAAAPFSAGSGVYLTTRTNHPIIFATGATSTEKMRITSDGKVGIGTANPGGNFSVVGSHANTIEAHIVNTNATGFSALRLGVDVISATRTVIHDFNGSYPGTGAYSANTTNFGSYNTNGLNITADNATGVIRMYTGGSLPANKRLTIDASGKVGINTDAPTEKLDVNGYGKFDGGGGGAFGIGSIAGVNRIQTATSGPTIRFLTASNAYANLSFECLSLGHNYANTAAPLHGAIIEGNVGIGTTDTKGYKLAVNGNAIFNKVKVQPYPWADYVFDKDYPLRPLSEVERFIKENHHLPEVPSAADIQKNGLDVGDNQATLLKKIEELTLYLIEQNKIVGELTLTVKYQSQKLEEQQKKIDRLEKQKQ